jgi:hypothetical protein
LNLLQLTNMKQIPTPKNDGRACEVTRAHVMAIRTRRGAWTRKQLEALGVAWPPVKGWLKRFNKPQLVSVSDWEIAAEDAGKMVKY